MIKDKVKGFALIKFLAVISTIVFIALLLTPMILNFFEKDPEKTEMRSVFGLAESAIKYYASSIVNPEDYPINPNINIIDKILYVGEKPEAYTDTGYGVYLNIDGKVAMAISYNGICYKKKYTDNVIITSVYDKVTCVAFTIPRKESLLNESDPSYEIGLIPIVYDGLDTSPTYRKWIKADVYSTTNTWYNYETSKWANAVMVTDASIATYEAANAGTEILEADILGYLVWIPRFEYKFTGMEETKAISINFIPKTITTPSDAVNYKVHPAFTFGTKELSGIWVGKFETTGTATNPTVKPNLSSLRSQDVSTQFDTSQIFNTYGLGSSNDAHMMKNSEWGAVAYLSHSIYGSCSDATTCIEPYINNSSSYLTGRSGGAAGGLASTVTTQYPSSGSSSAIKYYDYGYYTYDGKIVEYGGATNTYAEDITLGTGASTTGNIYGIYDMSGGAFEYVMSAYSNPTNNNGYPGYSGYDSSSNSGYNGWLGSSSTLKNNGKSWPASKYYDLITNTTAATACNGGICYGQALSETTGWYGDYAYMFWGAYPWFIRGGYSIDNTETGIFSFIGNSGVVDKTVSFRLTVSAK